MLTVIWRVTERKMKDQRGAKNQGQSYCSNFSPCRVIDAADVVPFPDPVKKRSCCGGTWPPVVVGRGKKTGEKKSVQHHIQSMGH